MAIILISIGMTICVIESGLWLLFQRKITDMHFPQSMDASSLRFFSMTRMELLAISHTMFLCITTILTLWLLW